MTVQLSRADLKSMTPEAIVEAQRAGTLDEVLGMNRAPAAPDDLPRVPQLSREALKSMTPEEISKANSDGRLARVLGGRPPIDFDRLDK